MHLVISAVSVKYFKVIYRQGAKHQNNHCIAIESDHDWLYLCNGSVGHYSDFVMGRLSSHTQLMEVIMEKFKVGS